MESEMTLSDGGPLPGIRKIQKKVRYSAKMDVNSFFTAQEGSRFRKITTESRMCAIRRNWIGEQSTDIGKWVENEKKARFGARSEDELRRGPTRILCFLTVPDFMWLLQEFSI